MLRLDLVIRRGELLRLRLRLHKNLSGGSFRLLIGQVDYGAGVDLAVMGTAIELVDPLNGAVVITLSEQQTEALPLGSRDVEFWGTDSQGHVELFASGTARVFDTMS